MSKRDVKNTNSENAKKEEIEKFRIQPYEGVLMTIDSKDDGCHAIFFLSKWNL